MIIESIGIRLSRRYWFHCFNKACIISVGVCVRSSVSVVIVIVAIAPVVAIASVIVGVIVVISVLEVSLVVVSPGIIVSWAESIIIVIEISIIVGLVRLIHLFLHTLASTATNRHLSFLYCRLNIHLGLIILYIYLWFLFFNALASTRCSPFLYCSLIIHIDRLIIGRGLRFLWDFGFYFLGASTFTPAGWYFPFVDLDIIYIVRHRYITFKVTWLIRWLNIICHTIWS